MDNVLVLGSGGREHALAWRLAQDSEVENVYVLPGNPGMERTQKVKCLEGSLKNFEDILNQAKNINSSLIVVGPEDPLANGITDFLVGHNMTVLGPTEQAALLESSKAFCKDFMQEFAIPTAKYKNFDNYESAVEDLDNNSMWDQGVVVKASSLAAGKGVFVCNDKEDAKKALYNIMKNDDFTVNSESVVLEQVLKGKELSAFVLCDGESFIPLGIACDHKRLLDDDKGPNTGGMGTYIPQNWPSENVLEKINKDVFEKTVQGMKERGTPFKGILFAGLMIDEEKVDVIEFNVRFGDPEAQVVMPTLKGNLYKAFLSAAKSQLKNIDQNIVMPTAETAVHVVKVSKGYPALDGQPMLKNQLIREEAITDEKAMIFFAGVGLDNNQLINTGGRVLGVTAIANSINEARDKAYKNLDNVTFEGAFWRRDIASK